MSISKEDLYAKEKEFNEATKLFRQQQDIESYLIAHNLGEKLMNLYEEAYKKNGDEKYKKKLEHIEKTHNLTDMYFASKVQSRYKKKEQTKKRLKILDYLVVTINCIIILTFLLLILKQCSNVELASKTGTLKNRNNVSITEIATMRTNEKEGELILKTALLSYKQDHGYYPPHLVDLADDYPNNYVSYIPSGDWVYAPSANTINQVLTTTNATSDPDATFHPLEIYISLEDQKLYVISGKKLLRKYPIAIGKPSTPTPTGVYAITERVVNPNGGDGAYSSRGLEFSKELNLAIHGTNDTQSIGRAISGGCIRMYNQDIEKLFDLIPLGTKVTIATNNQAIVNFENHLNANGDNKPDNVLSSSDQTNPNKTYTWQL